MSKEFGANKGMYLGLFTISLCTLMYEILLTRIFSVTMWYHFAFAAISIAMFGMTIGAILVYLLPKLFTAERVKSHLVTSSLGFSYAIVFAFLTHLIIHHDTPGRSLTAMYAIAFNYAILTIPFIFSGICICLALTKFPRQISRLYAADLMGAGLGCVLLVYMLEVTDGPTAVIGIAFLASVGALFFISSEVRSKSIRAARISSVLLGIFVVAHTIMIHNQLPWLRLVFVKGSVENRALYEKWNSFSRIRITGDPNQKTAPQGWGMSPVTPKGRQIEQLNMKIDGAASTVLTRFDGDVTSIEYLKYDITNIVHYLRDSADVLVVGSGGGRDILSSLVFKQRSVLGVEINEDIIEAVNGQFGGFTGHLDRRAMVRFVGDEARSYVSRSSRQFDIIQVSLIDTWAATAAGAFVLTENSLYTVEAWKTFIAHLTRRGILNFSRWYSGDNPLEIYRLTALARKSLLEMGVRDPRQHMMIIAARHGAVQREGSGLREKPARIGTILVSKEPFTRFDLDRMESVAKELQFEVILSPDYVDDATLAGIVSGNMDRVFFKNHRFDISPPTDDKPFFFYMLRGANIFKLLPDSPQNMEAIFVLWVLFLTVVFLTFLCIAVPLLLGAQKGVLRGSFHELSYFMCIGLGFMLVEISQMQRLIIFLGHPNYGLSVVLFALLMGGGIGSFLTNRISDRAPILESRLPLVGLSFLLVSLVFFGLVTPLVVEWFGGASTAVRILLAFMIVFTIGLFMGMAFPLGMKLASSRSPGLTPWLWGINGGASVCASVLAVVISLNYGIRASYWSGVVCYLAAVIAFVAGRRSSRFAGGLS